MAAVPIRKIVGTVALPLKIVEELICTYQNLQKINHTVENAQLTYDCTTTEIEALHTYIDENIQSFSQYEKEVCFEGLRILYIAREQDIRVAEKILTDYRNDFFQERIIRSLL